MKVEARVDCDQDDCVQSMCVSGLASAMQLRNIARLHGWSCANDPDGVKDFCPEHDVRDPARVVHMAKKRTGSPNDRRVE